jgi:uncharacterized protein YjbI with pentapeptide repeats
MADEEQLRILKAGVPTWNQWRGEHQDIRPDLYKANFSGTDLGGESLSEADLSDADLTLADLSGANLNEANLNRADLAFADLSETNLNGADLRDAYLVGTDLRRADLSGARLSGAFLGRANLSRACLRRANLCRAHLGEANLSGANLSGAHLSEANLQGAILLDTMLDEADLTGCHVYGVSVWGVHLKRANQANLIITPDDEPQITVDNLEVAQFIYLLLNNERIREVIDTITSKVVLILGRFTPERKAVLDALRDMLRERNYLPVLFDFDKPACF